MSKKKLNATTPAGQFTRTTASQYSHVVVWNSPRAMKLFTRVLNGDEVAISNSKSGVYARWVKDRGHGVTWHSSVFAAKKAAAHGNYAWDGESTLVGIFDVAAETA